MMVGRARLSRHLLGTGFELGPGHAPFPLAHEGVEVRYVDRWNPEENAALFPELGPDATFPEPDIVANLDMDRLGSIGDGVADFVIASHVLEHVADPIGLLADIHRVLCPGGVLLIFLPDRHVTFDRMRRGTTLQHLADEHQAGVTEVDDAHIEEFLDSVAAAGAGARLSEDPVERKEQIDANRRRSIHVHCWDQDEFEPVLRYCVDPLGQRWEFVDAALREDGGPDSIEFGFVVRKSVAVVHSSILGDRFGDAWMQWRTEHRDALGQREGESDTELRLMVAATEIEALRQERDALQNELDSLRSTKTFRYTALGRRAFARLR